MRKDRDIHEPASDSDGTPPAVPNAKKKHRSRWRIAGIALLVLATLLVAARLALPSVLRWYVNRTIDQSQLYRGEIGDISVHLWRGAYSINDIRLVKITGNVPVPLYSAKRVDLAMQWDALVRGKAVGRITMIQPELNFVAAADESNSQSGVGGPWLEIIRDLFPFKINSALVHDGTIHFRAFHTDPPVDVYLSQLEASIENLTNIHDEVTPLLATVKAKALAMDQAKFEYEMKMDPFSYRPTFELAVRLLGLDVRKINALSLAYGSFDFEKGWFDLVVELNAREGQLIGYVKPLFRNIQVFSLDKDLGKDNPLEFFWELLVGVTTELLKNQPRNQFATVVPLRGDLSAPQSDILAIIGNVLRNAFIRAYLPRLRGAAPELNGLEFGTGSIVEPSAIGNEDGNESVTGNSP